MTIKIWEPVYSYLGVHEDEIKAGMGDTRQEFRFFKKKNRGISCPVSRGVISRKS